MNAGTMRRKTTTPLIVDPQNLVRTNSFSLDRLLSHTDPGPAEESEALVRFIYQQRHIDATAEGYGKTRR